ncbi:glycoside hydrolase family 95 protein [Roseimarinus sediminis]|uniref:glycoside hydrolase family 95 protein n=1 Tax=Roseimarinus sediminis TaxID=1610899 RepID=UPI003D25E9CB
METYKKYKQKTFISTALLMLLMLGVGCSTSEQNKAELWYDEPALEWEEALPIGNGRLGAMIFGDPANEHLQLNEETLWDSYPRAYQREGAAEYLPVIRQLVAEGKQSEAEVLANDVFMGRRAYEDDYEEKRTEWLNMLANNELLKESIHPSTDDADWDVMHINYKSVWETKGHPDLDGCVVFRKTVELPESWKNKPIVLNMGKIKDHDLTWINGVKVGETNGYEENRIYNIPAGVLKPGKNLIVVQINNYEKTGGFNAVRTGHKKMHLAPRGSDNDPVLIEGDWKYKIIDTRPPWAPQYQANYQPFADIHIQSTGHENFSNYRRSLDLEKALALTSYEVNGVTFTREYLASNPDQSVVMKWSASQPGNISFTASLSSAHPEHAIQIENNNTLVIQLKVEDGVLTGEGRLHITAKGGAIKAEANQLHIENADEVVMKWVAATSFVNYKDVSANPSERCKQYLSQIESKDYKEIKAAHHNDYSALYNRFSLTLGGDDKSQLPTDERINGIKTAPDNGLAALYVQYARYLMLSSGRKGTNPPNLQGIWNKDLHPAWGSKYTTNINCEMNFWPVEPLNIAECHYSLFSMIEDLAAEGRKTAKAHYNSRGWVHHHNTDQWRGTAPINNSNHGIWVTGGAWLTHHLWEHYLYSHDDEWLKNYAAPIIKEAALFFVDFLTEDPETGYLISTPSNSPENGGLVQGPAMDHQIIRSLFKIALRTNELTGNDPEFETSIRSKLERVAPDRIGQYGQLQEWIADIDDPDNKHRHVSHLWGVHPGNEITWEASPELMNAAIKSLEMRGDEGTGWSLAWKINFWARFLDGEHAHHMVQMLLAPANDPERNVRGGSYPNLFDAHPPFQIDGNFGGAAGIIEMIMQSHQGYIDLLPALPQQWANGSIKGLRARGGFEIDMEWKDSKVSQLAVKSLAGQPLKLHFNDQLIEQETTKGETYKW